LFIDEERLFEYYDEEFDKVYTPQYREGKTQPIYHKFPSDSGSDGAGSAKGNAVAGKDAAQGSGTVGPLDAASVEDNVEWCGYDIQKIIDVRYGGDRRPSAKSRSRHKESLILATDLLLMLDGDKALVQRIVERQPWVQEIIRERDENVAQTVESAAKQMARREESTAEPYPSKAMQKAVEEVTGRKYRDAIRSVECRTESVERATAAESTSKNSCGAGANSKLSTLNSQLKVGDTVRIKGLSSIGKVESIDGKMATVIFGDMRTKMRAERLEHAEESKIQISKQEERNTNIVGAYGNASKDTRNVIDNRKLNFKQDIDVRGMRGDEAINAVTYFIDDAILVGVSRVRILHGTGTGILRQLIRQYLATIPNVAHFRDEHVQFGGAGITVVDLD
jgi:DNA mismatch repair protein MutS2